VLRESVRSLSREGREFVLHYSLALQDCEEGQQCRIQALLNERTPAGADRETGCSVEVSLIQPETGKRIFEMIAGAEDPVFPVHVPEIERDQLSAARMVAVKPCP
jgi:hypothetical protein